MIKENLFIVNLMTLINKDILLRDICIMFYLVGKSLDLQSVCINEMTKEDTFE